MSTILICFHALIYTLLATIIVFALRLYREAKTEVSPSPSKIVTFAKSIKSVYEKLYYSYAFPIIVCLATLFFWVYGNPYIGISFFVFLACPVFILKRDITPIYPLLFAVVMLFRDFTATANPYFYLLLTPAAIFLIARFFLYPIKKPCIGKLFFPLVFVSIAMLTGGILSEHLSGYTKGLAHIISLGPAMLFIYFFFFNYTEKNNPLCSNIYIIFSLLCSIVLACIQLCLIRVPLELGAFQSKAYDGYMGWGHFNAVGSLILIAVPLCFYLICKTEKLLSGFITLIFLHLSAIASGSDGVLAILMVFTPLLFIYTYFKLSANKRNFYLKFILSFLLVIAIVGTIFAPAIPKIIMKFINSFSNDNGRTKLCLAAIDVFKKYPIFGAGLGYTNNALFYSEDWHFNFHSTLFHVLGTMGSVGLVAYIIYFIVRIRIFAKGNTLFGFFSLVSFIAFESYAMIDTCEFTAIPSMIMITLLVLTAELANKKDSELLPLVKKHLKY